MAVNKLERVCETRRECYHQISIINDFYEYLLLVPVFGSVLRYIYEHRKCQNRHFGEGDPLIVLFYENGLSEFVICTISLIEKNIISALPILGVSILTDILLQLGRINISKTKSKDYIDCPLTESHAFKVVLCQFPTFSTLNCVTP